MLIRTRQFLAPPIFEDDEEKTRTAALLSATWLVVTLAALVGIVLLFVTELGKLTPALITNIVLFGLLLALRFVLVRGYVRVTSVLLLCVLWLNTTALIYVTDGIQHPATSSYLVIVILASLLLGERAAVMFGSFSVLALLVLFYAQTNDLLDFTVTSESNVLFGWWVALTIILSLTVLLLRFAVRGIDQGFERARHNERALAESHREMQASRDALQARTRDLERQSVRLRAAAEVGRTAASIRDLDQLLSQVVHLISEYFDFYHAGIFLLDETGRHAVLRAASSPGGMQMLAEGHRLAVGEQGIVGHVTGVREPRIALDVGEEAVHFEYPHLPHTRSEIALPLVAGDRLLGALDIQSTEQAAFSPEDITVLQVLTNQVAVAIENAYLFVEGQAALEAERRAYGEISTQAWTQMMGEQADLGYLCDAQRILPAGDQWQPEMVQARQAGQTVQEGGSTVAIPIKIRDHATGAVRLRKPDDAGEWTTDEITLMEDLTRQLGLTLESARHYRETQRRALREQMTTEITARIRETLDMDTVLQTAIREMGDRLSIARVEVRMSSEDKGQEGHS